MDGSPDGSKRKVKMDLSAMLVATGKPESRETGMDVQIYLANSMKTLWNLLKGLELMWVYITLKTAFLRFFKSDTSLLDQSPVESFCAAAPLFMVKREAKALTRFNTEKNIPSLEIMFISDTVIRVPSKIVFTINGKFLVENEFSKQQKCGNQN